MFGWFWIIPLAILAILLTTRLLWWRRWGAACSPWYGPSDARAILDARLARGEITIEEHARLRDALAARSEAR